MTADEIRRMLDALKHDLLRQQHADKQLIMEELHEIKVEVKTTNGRVRKLEEKDIARNAADRVRAELAEQAVKTAAVTAAKVAAGRERSFRWWSLVIAATSVAVTALATIAGLITHLITYHH